MSTGTAQPSPDEVVTALAQTAFIALVLTVIVIVTRAAQVYMDKKQAERAHFAAAQASQLRFRTLAEGNTFYQSNPAHSTATALDPSEGYPAGGGFSGTPSSDSEPRSSTVCSLGSVCPTPPAAPGVTTAAAASGGTASLLLAACSLLQRRQQRSSSSTGDRSSWRYGRSGSMGTEVPAGGQNLGGDGFSNSTGEDVRSGAPGGGVMGQDGSSLASLSSDGRLETSRILGSVPPDTIISTRQVLVTFNYDYSALHRRESSYAGGVGRWNGRAAPRM